MITDISVQSWVILVFGIVSLIAILLFLFSKYSKFQLKKENKISLSYIKEFDRIIRSANNNCSITEITKATAKILKENFQCEKLILLRNNNGQLAFTYLSGVKDINLSEVNMELSPELVSLLTKSYLPRKISTIENYLSDEIRETFSANKINYFFSVFIKNKVCSIYFVSSQILTNSQDHILLLSSLMQSLSITCHELVDKQFLKSSDGSEQRLDSITDETFSLGSDNFLFNKRVLRLVNQKDSELLTMDILRSLTLTLSIENVALVYQSHEPGVSHLLVQGDQRRALTMNCNIDSEKVISLLSKNEVLQVNDINGDNQDLANFKEQLLGLEFDYITLFPLANSRNGIFAWSGKNTAIIKNRLDKFRAYALELFENADSFNRMKELSSTDSLTGLANHRYFTKRLEEEINRCERYKRKLALVFLDFDDFKSINDTYGHLAGDEILRSLGTILKSSIRSIDIVARYGGDEFCVIMPEVNEKTCILFMTRLKDEVSSYQFKAEDINGSLKCTISLGASIYPNHAKQAKKLTYLADMSLLKAKEAGKNRYIVFESKPVV